MSQMENKRLELHAILVDILGSTNVYFQPPESIKMRYPAIVYGRDGINDTSANNDIYNRRTMYQITVIDTDPDSEFVEKVANLPYCSFSRHFNTNDLNHDIFRLYF